MNETQILDLLERAYGAGCFLEVLKMIRAKSDITLIEKVIEKAGKNKDKFDPFSFDDLFGAD